MAERLPAVKPYRPARWLPGSHAQTILGPAFRRFGDLPLTRHRLKTPDGDRVALDVLAPARPGTPVVLLLHGLEGSSRSHYMQGFLSLLAERGWGGVALNFRGCDGRMNLTPGFYHSGDTRDPRLALDWMGKRFSGHPLLAAGFSLGGNVLGRLLGEEGAGCPVEGAAMICPPFDLEESAPQIDRSLGGYYGRRFLGSLKKKMIAKEKLFPGCVDLAAVRRAQSLIEFDDCATAPLHGFAGVNDYYRRCGCAPLVSAIRRPTLVLASGDDPLLPRHAVPVAALRKNRWVYPVLTRRGGHLGFVEGPHPRAARWWGEWTALEWFQALVSP